MNEDVKKLMSLVEELMDNVDDEMEHGDYHTPDVVPYKFEDEEDYYKEHEEIVNRVVECRINIRNLIKKIRNSH